MTTLLDLYRARRDVVQRRQQHLLPLYDQLHHFLLALKASHPSFQEEHPYDLAFELKKEFARLRFYACQSFGAPARIPQPDDGYVYRMCSIVDVVKGVTKEAGDGRGGAADVAGWRNDLKDDQENWEQVFEKGGGDWTPLNGLAEGVYKCHPRPFSWWTTFPLYEDVIAGAHRIGMTNDWVAVQCLVLRCPADYVRGNNIACVPSAIDAYTQMIFHPTRDEASPPHGITIDLSLYPLTLFPGTDEFLLPPVPVDLIEVKPVLVDEDYRQSRHTVRSDCGVFSALLEDYYKNLLAEANLDAGA